jgi:uncharacterized protein YjbI with pentapeptide repeats
VSDVIAALQSPDLPGLTAVEVGGDSSELDLSGALVAHDRSAADGHPAAGPVSVRRVRVRESELRGLVLEPGTAAGLTLVDVVLDGCGLSNVDGREGLMTRVELRRSQLVGFGFTRGEARDLRVVDSSLQLAAFTSATLHNVVFERVNLGEASFMDARLDAVAFLDCRLEGVDFRDARLSACAIRGASLDGVLGVESLRGVRMPWSDVLSSAGALAAALGITIEHE